jgi:hypothetical protein
MAEALAAVQADAEAPAEGVLVPLVTDAGEFEVTVPPVGKWRTAANKALREGDFDTWAQMVLSKDDFKVWLKAESTTDDAAAFFEAWGEVVGEDPKESRPSRRSSRSTARK